MNGIFFLLKKMTIEKKIGPFWFSMESYIFHSQMDNNNDNNDENEFSFILIYHIFMMMIIMIIIIVNGKKLKFLAKKDRLCITNHIQNHTRIFLAAAATEINVQYRCLTFSYVYVFLAGLIILPSSFVFRI